MNHIKKRAYHKKRWKKYSPQSKTKASVIRPTKININNIYYTRYFLRLKTRWKEVFKTTLSIPIRKNIWLDPFGTVINKPNYLYVKVKTGYLYSNYENSDLFAMCDLNSIIDVSNRMIFFRYENYSVITLLGIDNVFRSFLLDSEITPISNFVCLDSIRHVLFNAPIKKPLGPDEPVQFFSLQLPLSDRQKSMLKLFSEWKFLR